MKRRWVMIDGALREVDAYAPPQPRKSPYIASEATYQYECPITGKPIDGRADHRENLARHDCRLLEPGERRDQPKRVEEDFTAKTDAILDRALGQFQ